MYKEFEPKTIPIDDKIGTGLMNDMLIDQYKQSPIFIAYMSAFMEEIDLVFIEVQKIYHGRMLEYATGVQLDIIGVILNLKRTVVIDRVFFGLKDEAAGQAVIAGMADEATPSQGGIFRSDGQVGDVVPLEDSTYRTMLRVKALCSANFYKDINFVYRCIGILLGSNPPNFQIIENGIREATVNFPLAYVTADQAQVVAYMARYFIAAGTKFNINLA